MLEIILSAGDVLHARLRVEQGEIQVGFQQVGQRLQDQRVLQVLKSHSFQGCQMVKFDPFLSLDCARVEGMGAQSKERKGSNFAA